MTAPAYDPWDDPWSLPVPAPAPEVTPEDGEAVEEDLVRYLPAVLAEDVSLAVEDWRDPEVAHRFAADLRGQVLENVRAQHTVLQDARPAGRVTDATVKPELSFLTSAANALDEVAAAVKAGADEARLIAGEVLVDVSGDERKRATVKVADEYGPIRAVREQPTKVSVRAEDVVDVLAASLVAKGDRTGLFPSPDTMIGYAAGVRQGIAALLELTSAPAWKSTALDALARQLEEAGEDALALRLSHAYGRVPAGKPKVTLSREDTPS